METLYRQIEIKNGNSTEPVQYVGVYTLNWKKEWGEPEYGFVEIEEIKAQPVVTDGEIENVLINAADDMGSPLKIRRAEAKILAKAIIKLIKKDKDGR